MTYATKQRISNTPELFKICPIRGTTPTSPCPLIRHPHRCVSRSKQAARTGTQPHNPLRPSHCSHGAHPLARALTPDPGQAGMGPFHCFLVAAASVTHVVAKALSVAIAEARADANA